MANFMLRLAPRPAACPGVARHLRRTLLSTSPAAPAVNAAEIAKVLSADPVALRAVMNALPPASKKQAGLQWALAELEDEFTKADKNADGKLSFREFRAWAHEVINTGVPTETAAPPTGAQLRACFLVNTVPYIGFGMVDNSIMIVSGEAIDHSIGAVLGLSTLGAAAL